MARTPIDISNASCEGLLNIEGVAFRAYDSRHGCGAHSSLGSMPLEVSIRGPEETPLGGDHEVNDGECRPYANGAPGGLTFWIAP